MTICIFKSVLEGDEITNHVLCLMAFDGLGQDSRVLKRSYYTVVLDCGSTGSRVNVYEWTMNGIGRDLPVLIRTYPDNSSEHPLWKTGCSYHCMQTKPGLDKFVGNFSGVRASLEPLILRAEKWVPRERYGGTPIFILATAGLRKLPSEDARRVLEDAEAVVKEHSFMHRTSWIRVLSGKEEAYYGWVSLNYKMGILGNSSRFPSLGLLDLGGSSLQVAMEIDELRDGTNFVRSKIGLSEHKIMAHSFPTFGLNEAFDETVVMLSQMHPPRLGGRFQVRHPCLSSGFVQNYTCHGCFGLNSSSWRNTNGRKNQSALINLVGKPGWEQCQQLARAVVTNSTSLDWSSLTGGAFCKESATSSSGNNTPNLSAVLHPVTRFHALSGFFAVYNTLNLSRKTNLTKILERGQQLCSRSWAETGSRNTRSCFRVPYMFSLIKDALCLGNVEIVFGPGDVSWPLGAALVEGEHLGVKTSGAQSGISSVKPKWVRFSPIYLFVLLLCLLLLVYYSQVKLPMMGTKYGAVGVTLPSYIFPKQRPN